MSKTGIKISSKVDKASITAAADAIAKILTTAHQFHADQATTQQALQALTRLGSVEGVGIHNCHISDL